MSENKKNLTNVLAQNGLFDHVNSIMDMLNPFKGKSKPVISDKDSTAPFISEESSSITGGGPEQFVPFEIYDDAKIEKLYDAIHYAEWKGLDSPQYTDGDYFTRTWSNPEDEKGRPIGSSAYGPVQITGGLLANYFGDKEMLESLPKNKVSANLLKEQEKGIPSRTILSDEELEFVDALIMQAYNFSFYGAEDEKKKLEGYSSVYEYGGRGDVEEQFSNYRELYKQVAKKLIALQLDSVGGDEIAFAKKWRSGKEKFTDTEYLKKFKEGLAGEKVKGELYEKAEIAHPVTKEEVGIPIVPLPISRPEEELETESSNEEGFLPIDNQPDYGYQKVMT